MNELEQYYNKFNEDKRLLSRHGQVEFITSMKYIEECLNEDFSKRILDIGAGTGAYSVYLSEKGYNVDAVELVEHNIKILLREREQCEKIKKENEDLKKQIEDLKSEIEKLKGEK